MTVAQITLIKGDRHSKNTDYRDYLPVNMVAILRPMFGAAGYMLQSPGLTQYGEGSGIDRGGVWNERLQLLFRVSGNDLISVDTDGSVTVLGTIPGTDTVSLPYSFNTQAIIADGNYYLYDPTNGFRQVIDADVGDPIDAVWVDGYYFFTDGDYLYHTDISDEESINPLNYATAEFSPDPTLAVALTPDDKVMVFGRYSIEYFINQANDNFAFTRASTRGIKMGIVGTHCQEEIGGQFYVLGGAKNEHISVYVVSIGAQSKVGSREVDKILAQYTEAELTSAVLESYQNDGYTYLIVHLPNEVLQFNVTVSGSVGVDSAWSILKSDVAGELPWRAKHIVFDPRRAEWVCGDKFDSILGMINNQIATQYDRIIEWLLYTPFIYLEEQSIDEFEVETIPGFNVDDDATVFLSLTYDGTTHGQEYVQLYSHPNDYNQRFKARRLGYVSDWVGFKLRGATRSRMAFGRGMIDYG